MPRIENARHYQLHDFYQFLNRLYTSIAIQAIVSERTYRTHTPFLENGVAEVIIGYSDITIFADDLKMYCGTGSEIFSDKLALNESYRLPKQASLF